MRPIWLSGTGNYASAFPLMCQQPGWSKVGSDCCMWWASPPLAMGRRKSGWAVPARSILWPQHCPLAPLLQGPDPLPGWMNHLKRGLTPMDQFRGIDILSHFPLKVSPRRRLSRTRRRVQGAPKRHHVCQPCQPCQPYQPCQPCVSTWPESWFNWFPPYHSTTYQNLFSNDKRWWLFMDEVRMMGPNNDSAKRLRRTIWSFTKEMC